MAAQPMLRFVGLSLALAGLAACSGSDSDGNVTTAGPPAAFASYCTGTLLVGMDLQAPSGPSAWSGNGSESVAAGTTVLLGIDFDGWEGFVFQANGGPLRLSSDFKTGLVKGTHFTSDCADDAKLTSGGVRVLLADSTFYPNKDATGTACTMPAGTELSSFSFISAGSVASVSATEIEAQCGLSPSYSKDIVYAELVLK